LLVSPRDLAARLANQVDTAAAAPGTASPGWVVVDCRFNLQQPDAGRASYLEGHIPGALYADLDRDLAAPRGPDTGRHPLPDPEQLRLFLGRLGIDASTTVVAYDDAGGGIAARLWWLLRWMGHGRALLLDGGIAAWRKAGLPVSQQLPEPRPARFTGTPGHMPVLHTNEVAAALAAHAIRLLDVRAEERFLGRAEPIDPVAGHIPGAVNVPFSGNLGVDQQFQHGASLAKRYEPMAQGRQPGEIVCMCGSGVTACHGIFALELAGMPGAALYPGSWSEWIRSPDRPVVTS
jgi:thiosulfate/3-mercaptopyruvate sulfurtransferase